MGRLAHRTRTLGQAMRGRGRFGAYFPVVVYIVLAVAVVVFLLGPIAWWVGGGTVAGLPGKARADAINGVRQSLLTAFAGIGASVGLFYTARTYTLSRSGQVTDRFSKAVGHLGSGQAAQRVGGVYALERIMRDSAADEQTVVEVLISFIRDQAGHPPEWYPKASDPPPSLGLEVQAALTVIGRRPEIPGEIQLDLARTSLAHAYLNEARLSKANFSKADLRHVHLYSAQLQGARMGGSWLQAAHLRYARLQRARLGGSHLESADLNHADLRGAVLEGAHLEDAKLCHANLGHADFGNASFSEGTNLTGAILAGAKLQRTRGLTARHLKNAVIDGETKLPGCVRAELGDAGAAQASVA